MRLSITIPTIKLEKELLQQTDEIRKSLFDYREGEYFEIIVQSCKQSAAKNRNAVLKKTQGDYVVMLDDDIQKFPKNWACKLIESLDNTIRIVSARLMTTNNTPATMISFRGNIDLKQNVWINPDGILPSACIAFSRETWQGIRDNKKLPLDIPFDENIPRACCEDTTYCMVMALTFPGSKVAVNTKVKVIHREESKWRTKNPADWQWNHNYFRKRFGRDPN